MIVQVGSLRCSVSLLNDRCYAPVAESAVRSAFESDLGRHLEPAPEATLSDGDVWVIRNLDLRVARPLGRRNLARQLAAAIAGGVRRTIAENQAANVAYFRSLSEYQASLVEELLNGDPRARWEYQAMAHYLSLPRHRAVAAIVRESMDRGALWGELARLGIAGAVAEIAGDEMLELAVPGATADQRISVWQPIVRTVAAVLNRLGRLRTGADIEQGIRLLALTKVAPDWRDRDALTSAALQAIRLLLEGPPSGQVEVDRDRLRQALGEVDWIDVDRVLESLIRPGLWHPEQPIPDRARKLLIDLTRAAEHSPPSPTQLGPAGVIALWASLMAVAPEWSDDRWSQDVVRRVAENDLEGASPESFTRGLARVARQLRSRKPANATRSENPTPDVAFQRHVNGDQGKPDRFVTSAAGLFLLARSLRDLRLSTVSRNQSYPPAGWSYLAAAAFELLAGPVRVGADARAIRLLAGLDPSTGLNEVADDLAQLPEHRHLEWQTEVLELLRSQRLLQESRLSSCPIERRGRLVFDGGGFPLLALTADSQVAELSLPQAHIAQIAATRDQEVTALARESFETLIASAPGPGLATFTAAITACAVLRAFRRWLPGFSDSSVPFLLTNMLRRPGRVVVNAREVTVELDSLPHDPVLDLAGYFEPVEPIPGGPAQRFIFSLARQS